MKVTHRVRVCDRLIQAIACLGACSMLGMRAQCGHHLIHRSNMFFRHDLRNIAPLTIYNHTGAKFAPHVSPVLFADAMRDYWPEQYDWWQANKNEIHKDPTRAELLETRDYLRAFLAAGVPFRFTEAAADKAEAGRGEN